MYDLQTASSLYHLGGLLSSNCRCAWRDAKAFRPPSSGRRKLAKSSIEKAIVRSLREEGDVDFDDEGGWGAGRSIGERRPITNEMLEFSRVINSGCGAGAPGHPGFLPGNTCGGENPGKIEIHSDNSRIEVRYGETRTLNLPTGPIEVPGPTAVVSAFIDKGKNQVTLSSIHVDESLRGKGIGSHIIGEVVKESAKKGLPVRTTGVFSQAGKGLMDKLVREGKAVELDGGDYHLISQVINSGCGAGAPGHPGFLPGNVCSQRPQNPLPRVSQQDELRMEMALRKAAGGDTIREFISYSASEENVPLALLHSPQTVKDEKSVKYFKDNPESIDSIQPLPLVIQFGGRMIVRDGNSRAVAAMESGRDSLKVRVVYVPDTGE